MERAVPRRLMPGECLYIAGDRGHRLHLVLRGALKLTGSAGAGSESILFLAVPGELVGDVAAVDGRHQPLDAVAAGQVVVLGLDAELFEAALARSAPAALELVRLMAGRIRWMSDATVDRATSAVPARLAGRLLDLADLLGRYEDDEVEIQLPLGQRDLGRLAGMCRESTCKTLRAFRSQGLVDYRGRRLRILRPDALRRIRCSGRI
ncbi:MAG: Crp/Fnr family transcriptional regulator [Actinomycetota bacterium]